MTQGTLFKTPTKSHPDNLMKIDFELQGVRHSENVDLVDMLNRGKLKDIPYATWNQERFPCDPKKVYDLTPAPTERAAFLRDMAIVVCLDDDHLIAHDPHSALENIEAFELLEEEMCSIHERTDAELKTRKTVTAQSETNIFIKNVKALWKDIQNGEGDWAKFL